MNSLRLNKSTPPPTLDSASWMITFSDLLTLLITFFVLRFSMSSLDFVQVIERIQNNDSATTVSVFTFANDTHKNLSPLFASALGRPIERDRTKSLEEFKGGIILSSTKDVTKIDLGSSAFFQDSLELSFLSSVAIEALTDWLKNNPYLHSLNILVEVNGSDLTLGSPKELSRARAMLLVRQMIDGGVDNNSIKALGYGKKLASDGNPISDLGHHNQRVVIEVRNKTALKASKIIKYN